VVAAPQPSCTLRCFKRMLKQPSVVGAIDCGVIAKEEKSIYVLSEKGSKVTVLDSEVSQLLARDVRTRMFEIFTYGIYRTRSPYVEKECRRSCRDGVLTLEVRAVRKPIRTRATEQLYSQSSMIPSL